MNLDSHSLVIEQGPNCRDLGERTANATDPMPMIHIPPEIESERVRSQHDEEQSSQRSNEVDGNKHAGKEGGNEEGGSRIQVEELQGDEDNLDEEYELKIGKTARTDTDWTLVGTEDEDEAKAKDYES